LAHGYAVVTVAPRGGRDDGDEWYDAGRTAQRKAATFKDTADVIAAVQRRFHIKPAHTIFYGRSAGGWLAAAIGLFYSHLVAAVYAEVPYLDVLRTSSNPALPLTQMEYDEFGDPRHKPEDYAALQTISPVDALSIAPEKAPFFLVRTALHDVQVYPYEALKFAKKARSLGWRVVVGVDSDGGHFAAEKDVYSQWSTDAAILDAIVSPHAQAAHRRRQTRRHAVAHRSRGTTRRRTSSRKQSVKTAVSPAAE
jgi:oligopeptidase B